MPEVVEKDKIGQFDASDFKKIEEFVITEHRRRQNLRKDRHKDWAEIDRQLRMEPDVKYKKSKGGKNISHKAWMPEMELPNQASALEILSSDFMKMAFPDTGEWFRAKSNVDLDFMERFRDGSAVVVGEELDPPSLITQENVDDYVQGWCMHGFRQFDHRDTWNLMAVEALKYGDGVGRARKATKPTFIHHSKGTVESTKKIPILAPVSIKDVFLDDSGPSLMADGVVVRPGEIFHQFKKLVDVVLAADRGKKDPNDEDGGWMPEAITGLEGDKSGNIEYLEYEGDLIVPKDGAGTLYIPNAIATVVIGKNGKSADSRLIRFRFRKEPYSSYLHLPYHRENVEDPYSTSPLMKGAPIQKAGSEALNRFMQAAILNTEPPMRYSRDDQFFRAKGGPRVFPGAQWPTETDVDTVKIGDPGALQSGYVALLQQYAEVTGITAPRLGSQTVSHTTAFAKDQEIERGSVRTVDFVRSTVHGPMTRWLHMFYEMSKETLGEETEAVYNDKFGGFVNVNNEFLPEQVHFEVYGAAGPSESAAKTQQKFQAIMTALQVNQLGVQQGVAEPLNYEAITKELLKEGGISDVDIFTGNEAAPGAVQGGPALQGDGGGNADAGAQALLLQTLSQQGGL